MNNRELLEAAAKAAGWPAGTSIAGGGLCMTNGLYWNPLTDDGDALRLAVKLRLDVLTCGRHDVQDEIQIGGAVSQTTFQNVDGDAYAAARRAIVRAAAAIVAR